MLHQIIKIDIDSHKADLVAKAAEYEQMALNLFEKSVSLKLSAKGDYQNYLDSIDIWAISTKCVINPKPLDKYLIGNGNGNADIIVTDVMKRNLNKKLSSLYQQLFYHNLFIIRW